MSDVPPPAPPSTTTLAVLVWIQGQHFVSPVSPDLPHPCVGLSSAVRGLIRLHDSEEGEWGTRDRSVCAEKWLHSRLTSEKKWSLFALAFLRVLLLLYNSLLLP